MVILCFFFSALSSCCHQCDLSEKVRVARSTSTKPQIVERPKRQIVHVNQTAKFVCRVKSDSPVTITWVKSQQELRNRPGSILLTDSSLIFLHVQKSDEGIYKCVARNRAGTSSSEAKLTVLGKFYLWFGLVEPVSGGSRDY